MYLRFFGKIIFYFVFSISLVFLPAIFVYSEDSEDKGEDIEKLEDKKEKVEHKLKKIQKKKEQLQREIYSKNAQLKKRKVTILEVEKQINMKQELIDDLLSDLDNIEKQKETRRNILKVILREIYYLKGIDIISKDTSGVFIKRDRLDSLKNKVEELHRDLEDLELRKKDKLDEVKKQKKEKDELLQEYVELEQKDREYLNKVTIEVRHVDATIAELNGKLSQIESSLSELLGGEFTTDDIVEAAKFASKKTGVREDFILGMLTQETSLGRFTGGCTYKQSKMGSKNEKIFKRITKDLDYNYKKKKVSCPLSYGIGGAMGVAQFMPTTWILYEKDVARYTGHKPPDPWDLTDGVMAMAVKLKRDGGDKKEGEYNAARRYYCGANIERKVCKNYANSVLYWTRNYKKLLK